MIIEPDFVVYFNRSRQYFRVYLWDVHPNTFSSWKGGRWGYFEKGYELPYTGLFGDMHFVKERLRIDTISHEIDHLRQEWLWANRIPWAPRNEEKIIEFKDRIMWEFVRQLGKQYPKARTWMQSLGSLMLD